MVEGAEIDRHLDGDGCRLGAGLEARHQIRFVEAQTVEADVDVGVVITEAAQYIVEARQVVIGAGDQGEGPGLGLLAQGGEEGGVQQGLIHDLIAGRLEGQVIGHDVRGGDRGREDQQETDEPGARTMPGRGAVISAARQTRGSPGRGGWMSGQVRAEGFSHLLRISWAESSRRIHPPHGFSTCWDGAGER